MDRASKELLAGAGLTIEQHGRVSGGDLLDSKHHVAHRVADPDYEFVVASDEQVYFRAVDDSKMVWAGPNADSFRRIVATWQRYTTAYRPGMTDAAEREFFASLRRELEVLGALPSDLPTDLEPLWSLLLFEAENGLG